MGTKFNKVLKTATGIRSRLIKKMVIVKLTNEKTKNINIE
jgi:hypothetical protein